MSGVSGPGKEQLRKLIVQVEKIADGRFHEELKVRLGAEAVNLVHEGFRTATDPYGHPWKPARRGGATLRDTGRLRSSFSSQPTSRGFDIGTTVHYAATHQYGAHIRPKKGKALAIPLAKLPPGKLPKNVRWTGSRYMTGGGKRLRRPVKFGVMFLRSVKIPRRQMVPEDVLGDRWERGFGTEADAAVSEHFEQT